MATFLFDEIIFGPVKSRRLGNSLGINLLPTDKKFCNFNCIYCECGWNKEPQKISFPTVDQVKTALEDKLQKMIEQKNIPDVITFAGNGEPTLHPHFKQIIEVTVDVRNKLIPQCKIAVLTNSTTIHNQSVKESLVNIDLPFLKIDSAFEDTIKLINNPVGKIDLKGIVDEIKKINHKAIIQTMFVRGRLGNSAIDNTIPSELNELVKIYKEINPQKIYIYSIARDTPLESLEKVTTDDLKKIAEFFKLYGITVEVT